MFFIIFNISCPTLPLLSFLGALHHELIQLFEELLGLSPALKAHLPPPAALAADLRAELL